MKGKGEGNKIEGSSSEECVEGAKVCKQTKKS